jgi:hypothetical protein
MALYDTIAACEEAGNAKDIERSASPPQRFYTIIGPIVQVWEMTITTGRREYLLMSKVGANAAVDGNDQTGAKPGETYSWSFVESVREVGSYKVIRLSEMRSYELVG